MAALFGAFECFGWLRETLGVSDGWCFWRVERCTRMRRSFLEFDSEASGVLHNCGAV